MNHRLKWIVNIALLLLLIVPGAIFALQGLSFLPSRVMYGRQEWVVIGAVMVIVGVALAVFANWRSLRAHPTNKRTN